MCGASWGVHCKIKVKYHHKDAQIQKSNIKSVRKQREKWNELECAMYSFSMCNGLIYISYIYLLYRNISFIECTKHYEQVLNFHIFSLQISNSLYLSDVKY